jgi:hypothetical protein
MDLAPHHFIIKYKSHEERIKLVDVVMKLIRVHELSDYQVEEKIAFIQNKIIYNNHTLEKGNNILFEEVEKEFFKVFDIQDM